MSKCAILLPLLVFSWTWQDSLPAQSARQAAVIEDPAADEQFPAYLAGLTIPSHGVEVDATMYVASGPGPHATVLLLHGLPGHEGNADLAQSIRRAGWNVLMFHYHGTWGSPRQVLVLYSDRRHSRGHTLPSRSGQCNEVSHRFEAGYAASRDPAITAVAMIAAVNVGRINADPEERVLRLKRWEAQLHPVRGTTASELFSEAGRHTQDWDYMNWAAALQSRPVLLVAADDQNYRDMEALAEALVRKHSADLNRGHVVTDHSFSDRRIALQHIVVEWLNKIIAGAKRER